MLHIRYQGRSYDVHPAALGIEHTRGVRDAEIKRRVARYLKVPRASLRTYVIDRPKTGALIVRPRAIYG